jgi:mono/diheme cytochrome c family protein
MKKELLVVVLIILSLESFAQVKRKSPPIKPLSPFQQTMLRGKAVYQKTCVSCHQKDGGGVMNLNPPLIRSPYVSGDVKTLIGIVLKGLNKEIEIEGELYSNPMPPQANLSDQQIADVLSYVRNNFENKATVVTASQVKAVRAKK